MADGDHAGSRGETAPREHFRNYPLTGTPSYFFNYQVERCQQEQFGVFGSKLKEKENEANISYDKPLADLFLSAHGIDSAFLQMLFETNEPIHVDALIDDLGTKACGNPYRDGHVMRLLDFLFVTGKTSQLAEEIVIRNTTYDLYVEDVDDQFGAMDLFTKAMCDSHTMMPRCAGMQLAFSLLATGHDALVPSALVYLAKGLGFYWDALLLARYHYGAEHNVTKMVHDVWAAATLVDEKFPMLKIARSLNTANLIEVACGLMQLASSKSPESQELFGAYRCLAIFLATDDSSLAPFERKLQVAEASSHMRSIYVTVLGWGKLGWARSMVVDISKRAFPGDIPTDICQIVLSCHLDLVEHLMRTQNIHTNAAFAVNDLKALAVKWKAEIGRMGGEMRKLRTGTAFAQKVLYEWLHQLTLLLNTPLVEDENPNLKMQCVFLAGQFLPDMLRWAATSQEEEKLVLIWPDLNLEINTREKDTSVHFTDSDDRRSRSLSVQSRRSSNTSRDDGRKQKKKGDVKEERPVLLVRKDQKPEGNKQNVSQPVQDVRKLLELPLAGTGGTHGQENQQSRGGNGETQQWPRGEKRQSQDARNSRGTTENGSEFHGGNDNTTLHPKVASLMADASKGLVPSAVAVPGSTSVPTAGAPAKVDGDAYAPPVVPSDDRRKTSEEKKKAAATPAPLDVAAPTMEQVVQSLSEASQSLAEPPQSPSEANQLTPLASERSQTPTNSVSQEMILAALEDSLNKKKASAVETTAEQQANSGQQSPAVITPKPTMGTAAANEARARRSQEHLLQPEQPLEEIEKEETTEEQKLPEGQLPARLQMEQEQSAAPTTIPEPTTQPPVPSLVAQAGEEESGAHSTPPEGLVLPPTHHTQDYASTSEESMLMLTPITEASRETLSTALSESDTTGLANDSMDTVFEESHDPNQTELHVDVDVHPSGVEQSQFSCATLSEQTTPAMSAESSLNHSPAMISHEEQYGKADTPAVSPHAQTTSPAATETRASDSSEQTTAVDQTTARMVDAVRSEAEDASQLHHPIVTPPAPLETHEEQLQQQQKETIVAPVVTEWDTTQQSGFETAQTMPPSVPAVSDAAPSFSVPPPPVDVQIQETPTQPQQTYSPSDAPSFGTKSTPVISPQQSQSAANVQQNGQQAQPTFVQQNYDQQPVQQMQSMMETQLQPPITQEGYQQKDQSSMPESTGEQLNVECGQPEVQEKVTSCGVRYKFSPSTSQEEVSDATVGAELAAQPQQQSVQEPVLLSPPGFSMLDDFLGVLGAPSNEVETGDMQPDISVSADVIASNSIISNMQSEGDRSVTATEIDELATMRCQAASELGGSDFGSSAPSPFSDASSTPPSVPSTAVTTPDYSQQQSLVENQYPHMNHLALGGGDAATSETQQTTQQQSGGFTSPYVDPFDPPKQQQKLPPLQPITNRVDAMAYQPRSSVADEPVFFGTGGGAQTAQQQNVAPQPSGGMTFHGKKDAPGDHSQSGFGGGGGSGFGGGGSSGFGGSDSGFGPSGHGGGGGFGGQREGRARGTGCFNCHEEGHRSNDCPQPKRVMNCYNCHKDGHSSAKCPEKILTAGFNGGSQDVRAGRSQSQQSFDSGQSGFRGGAPSGGAGFGGGNQSQQSTGGLSSGFGGGSGGAGFGGGNQSQQPTGGVSSGFGGGSGSGGQGFGDGQKGFGSGGGMGFGGGDNNQKNSQPRARGGRGAGRGARGGGGGRQFVSTGSAGLQQGANGGFSGF